MTALFAHLQHTDSILPKPFGPLSTAAPALTIMAANKDETGNRQEAIRGSFSNELYPLYGSQVRILQLTGYKLQTKQERNAKLATRGDMGPHY